MYYFREPMYHFNGPMKDFREAMKWYRVTMYHFRAPMYHFNGPMKDFRGAMKWYSVAMYHFRAPMYHFNVPMKDFREAMKWYSVAMYYFRAPMYHFNDPMNPLQRCDEAGDPAVYGRKRGAGRGKGEDAGREQAPNQNETGSVLVVLAVLAVLWVLGIEAPVLHSAVMDWEPLIAAAHAARARAYAPYSGFAVGAAILMEDGSIHAGANVENCIPALAICAERNAMTAAVSAGLRRPQAIAVVTETSPPSRPCGLCRQALAEFVEDLPILVVNLEGKREETTLAELLPHRFVLPR